MSTRIFILALLTGLAAFLTFSIQPMTGKQIMPLVGGTPHGWLVALAFFQSALMVGYGLVYFFRRWSAAHAAILVTVLLGLGVFFLPPLVGAPTSQNIPGPFALYILLWTSFGLPLAALMTIAPLAQRLYADSGAHNPYSLYALSNIGSFTGLLCYPFLLEPLFDLIFQTRVWSILYVIVAILLGLTGAWAIRNTSLKIQQTNESSVTIRDIGLWMILAAIPSSLLSGFTATISSDVASFPLLWVVPLAMYLLTYVLAFSESERRWHEYAGIFQVVGTGVVVFSLAFTSRGFIQDNWSFVAFSLAVFVATAFTLHRTLYLKRPAVSNLPLFYFCVAAGGAIGGSINAFLVPYTFPAGGEFLLLLSLALVFAKSVIPTDQQSRRIAIAMICFAVALPFIWLLIEANPGSQIVALANLPAIFMLLALLLRPRLLCLAVTVIVALMQIPTVRNLEYIYTARSMFGMMRVVERKDVRVFIHGTTIHGNQPVDFQGKLQPHSYFSKNSPFAEVMSARATGPVAIVGLGVGQTASYATENRTIDFYEIDPLVVKIANEHFDYLRQYPARNIIVGDGRLELTQSDQVYSLIILDAFTSDALPLHLITKEAIEGYRRHLTDDGLLLFNISNRHLFLHPTLAATGKAVGLQSLWKHHFPEKTEKLDTASGWLVMGTPENLERFRATGWHNVTEKGMVQTDTHSSVLPSFRYLRTGQ